MWAPLVLFPALFSIASNATQPPAAPYILKEDISGSQFFDHFNFDTNDDPTHGEVDYVTEDQAKDLGLLSLNSKNGSVRIAVDSQNIVQAIGSRGRPAVRIFTKHAFNTGLFIIDVNHVPEGKAVWPAFWSTGPHWPSHGEIDVIEGINNQPANQSTLHTDPGCTMPTPNASAMSGQFIGSLDCSFENAAKGCTTRDPAGSFGPMLNKGGGGVFALLWTESEIVIWFFPRGKIPQDILASTKPDPTRWGIPDSLFPLGVECSPRNFMDHHLILNTTFCGDWAGPSFSGSNGSGPSGSGIEACNSFVMNHPEQFTKAYWDINSIRVYSQQSLETKLGD